jgi:hypothetical protein
MKRDLVVWTLAMAVLLGGVVAVIVTSTLSLVGS